MAAGAVSLKSLTKYEEVKKLEEELIRLNVFIQVRIINSQGITYDSQTLAHDMAHELAKL